MASYKAIPSDLRIFAQVDCGQFVAGELMVGFETNKKVNRKILGYHLPRWLCLKNGQFGASAFDIGLIATEKRIIHRLIHRKCGAKLGLKSTRQMNLSVLLWPS